MRRLLVVGLVALVALGGAFGCWVSRSLGTRDALEGVDAGAARESGAGAREIGGGAALPDLDVLRELADRGELEALGERLEQALGAPATSEASPGELHVLLSVTRRLLGDTEAAVAQAERGVELLPDSSRAHFARAQALRAGLVALGREKDWTAVLGSLGVIGDYKSELAAAIELDPGNVPAREEELGVLLFAPWPVGSRSAGMARLAELEALDAGRGALWRAQLLAADEEHAEALAAVDAVSDDALDAATRDRRRLIRGELLQALERYRDAAAEYAPLVAREPRGQTGWLAAYQLVRMREKGRFELEEAVALARELIAARPAGDLTVDEASVHYRLGQCLAHLGRDADARTAFERSLELDPGQDRARDALDALDAPR